MQFLKLFHYLWRNSPENFFFLLIVSLHVVFLLFTGICTNSSRILSLCFAIQTMKHAFSLWLSIYVCLSASHKFTNTFTSLPTVSSVHFKKICRRYRNCSLVIIKDSFPLIKIKIKYMVLCCVKKCLLQRGSTRNWNNDRIVVSNLFSEDNENSGIPSRELLEWFGISTHPCKKVPSQ